MRKNGPLKGHFFGGALYDRVDAVSLRGSVCGPVFVGPVPQAPMLLDVAP